MADRGEDHNHMSKPDALLKKDSIDLLKIAFSKYADYCKLQDEGNKGNLPPCKPIASRAQSITNNAFQLIGDAKAKAKILAFNKGKDELGNKALKLIARSAIEADEGFEGFKSEIITRFALALKS